MCTRVGYPGSADRASGDILQSTLTDGILSKPPFEALWGTPGSGLARVLQHTAAISPGSSGGPLLDTCGNALGVNTSGGVSEVRDASGVVIGATAAQGIFFALDASELARALDQLDIQYEQAGVCGGGQSTSPASAVVAGSRSGSLWLIGLLAASAVLGAFFLYSRIRRPRIDDFTRSNRSEPESSSAPPGGDRAPPHVVARSDAVRLTGHGGTPHLTVDAAELRRAAHGQSFGRSPDLVDRPLAVDGLSRRHFRISLDRGRVFLEDLNSTNGTFVNGERLRPYRARQLRAGEEIAAGSGLWLVAALATWAPGG